jgi:AraC-like DNA-binding protein
VGIERDTRGTLLSEIDRFNYYPATPMASISWVFEGTLHMVKAYDRGSPPVLGPVLPSLVFSGPQSRPFASWSPGTVHAMSVAFFPEAIGRLLGRSVEQYIDRTLPLEEVAPEPLLACCASLFGGHEAEPFPRLEGLLQPLWHSSQENYGGPLMTGWIRSLLGRAAFSQAGNSLRQLQRRVKSWTGQNHRQLQRYSRVEEAFTLSGKHRKDGTIDLSGLAVDAGFSDQSHMGREVRRVTGLSPAHFDNQIASCEAFWFYRLIEGHVRERQ